MTARFNLGSSILLMGSRGGCRKSWAYGSLDLSRIVLETLEALDYTRDGRATGQLQ